jgi:uncharacterized membrane protein YedE/YeeE
MNLFFKGRIIGWSGIFFSMISFDKSSIYWKLATFSGLITSSTIFYFIFGFNPIISGTNVYAFDSPPDTMIANLTLIGFGVAGYLVGIGTKLANGCTSGHGVCGIPRFSSRSLVAVCTFMVTGMATASAR